MDSWDEKTVFLQALSLPIEQREAFLKRECPDQETLDRIWTLIRHHEAASDDFLSNTTKTAQGAIPASPSQIDEFKIIHRLGEGGMGVVYLAEDTILGRRVALKVLARHLTGSEQALARFREEARSAAVLKHPAIVPVFKFGHEGEDHYLVCEFVDGRTLAELIIEKRRALVGAATQDVRSWHRQAAEIVATIADALDSAHRARIVHRDVKPSNILIDRERGPRLTDFGIAKHLTEENRTKHTAVLGSCHYMSPEQADIAGAGIDQRSDIFSLGVVLYEMLGLRLPFEGATVQQVLRAVSECSPPRLRAVDRRIPIDLETICHKAIEKRPQNRYQTAAHVAADLRCFLAGDPILAKPPSVSRRFRRWARVHRTAWAATVLIALTIFTLVLKWQLQAARDASRAWFSVASDTSGYSVYLQRFDPNTGEILADAEFLGQTPVPDWSVPVGQYRITVASSGMEAFTEFNFIAVETGRARGTKLHAHESAKYSAQPTSSNPEIILHGVLTRPSDVQSGMVTIESGDYLCGQKGPQLPLFAERHVDLAAFMIDRREVANREYKEFADATGRPYPKYWTNTGYEESVANHPVVAISWADSEAYARWRGKRLPTYLEWQAAARGHIGRLYPWGDSTDNAPPEYQAYSVDLTQQQSRDEKTRLDLYRRYTMPVDFKDALGCSTDLLQVFGNVREITASVDMGRRDYIIMGRCWADAPQHTSLADVWSLPLDAILDKHGFRCAKSVAPRVLPKKQ